MWRLQLFILSTVQSGLRRSLPSLWHAALGLLLLIPSSALVAQKLHIADSVQSRLNIFAADSLEHLVCLDGYVVGDTIHIDAMRVPEQVQSTTGVVRRNESEGCGITLIVWHNHPAKDGEAPEASLYFSLSDQNTFLRYEKALYAIVGVRGAMCLWDREQIRAGWLSHRVPLWAIDAQCWRVGQ